MYDKHLGKKVEFQVVINNKLVLSFNTEKKRKELTKKLNPRTHKVTCITNVQYPWNLKKGIHNAI